MHDRLTSRFVLLGFTLCLTLAATLVLSGLFTPVEQVLNDWRTRFAVQSQHENRVVVIDINERSLAARNKIDGAWPWPRATIAHLLQILVDDYGVSSVAVDMEFPQVRPDDEQLAVQFKRPEVTGAITYDLDGRDLSALSLLLPPVPTLQREPGAVLANGPPVVANHAGIMPARAGHITPLIDSDGVLRRLPPLICTNDRNCRPSLTLSAFASLIEAPVFKLQAGHGLLAPSWKLQITTADGNEFATVPLTAQGMLTVPYRHAPRGWTFISAADILDHSADPAALKGVMVLVGSTALGLSDVIHTPVSSVAAGLVAHMEVLSALLDNDFPIEPKWGLALDALLLLPFVVLLMLALLFGRLKTSARRAFLFPAWLVASWVGCAAGALLALTQLHLLLPLMPLLLFPPLAVLLILVVELYRSGNEHAGVLSLLAAYLPRPVATRLASFKRTGTRVDTTMDASRRAITVLFADVHGFAGMTENRPPEIIARLMQRFFSEMAEAVVANNGTIDKFIGDAIMAFWNAPDDDSQHPQNALAAARDIQRRIEGLAPFCAELGVDAISVGIGIESGEALVGNFGSAHRRTFTALGEPVVLASRLEGMTTGYNEAILIGPVCANALGLGSMRALGEVRIRGRVQALKLYAPN